MQYNDGLKKGTRHQAPGTRHQGTNAIQVRFICIDCIVFIHSNTITNTRETIKKKVFFSLFLYMRIQMLMHRSLQCIMHFINIIIIILHSLHIV